MEEELRRSARLLVEAQALGHVGIWELDAQSGELYSSAENRRLFFGPDSAKGGRGEDYLEALHPGDRERVVRQNEELVAGRGSPEIEFRVVWSDGTVHWILGHKQIVRDASGKRLREVGTNADITDRKCAEEDLRQRIREQEAIAQLGQAALRPGTLLELFERALHTITSACSLEFAEVAELSADEMLLLRGAVGWKEGLVGHARLPAGSGSQCAFTLVSGEPSVVEDFGSECRFDVDPLIRDQGMTSGVTVVIGGAGRPYGTLGMHSRDRRTFTRESINFLQSAANVLAAAIERERAETALLEQRAALSRRLIEAQEAERRSIARELHDDFGQVLTAIRLNLERAGVDLGESIDLVDQAIGRVRDLALDLRPAILDDLGLASALRWYGARETKRAGLVFRAKVADIEERLSPVVEITCFRLVQEALTNAVRHAQARSVTVTLDVKPDELVLDVSDDGRGFDLRETGHRVGREGLGLVGMQERVSLAGGTLSIDAAPGRGTVIRARFPRLGRDQR
jgi:signal transduction histidine kinase